MNAGLTGPDWLADRLAAGEVVVIDGAVGTELEARGVPMNDQAWCGVANLEHADVVRAVHEDYIRAGAEVIIANTFATARHMLEPAGYGDRVVEANRRAVAAALAAREAVAEAPVAVAGSISHFIAPGADARWRKPAVLAATFREQAETLAEAGVELIALEMMQRPELAGPALEAALATGLPVWVGVSARVAEDGRITAFNHPDQDLGALVEALVALGGGVYTVMHSTVPDTGPALEVLRARWSGVSGAYPEAGYFKMPHWQFVDVIAPADLVAAAHAWVDDGARVVGGCCGIGPAHIGALRAAFPRAD